MLWTPLSELHVRPPSEERKVTKQPTVRRTLPSSRSVSSGSRPAGEISVEEIDVEILLKLSPSLLVAK